jgi:hypothetical protein
MHHKPATRSLGEKGERALAATKIPGATARKNYTGLEKSDTGMFVITPAAFKNAAIMWLDMEDGLYVDEQGKRFPAEVNLTELARRTGVGGGSSSQTFLRTREFEAYVGFCRRMREAEMLPAKYQRNEMVRSITNDFLEDIKMQLAMERLGLVEPIPMATKIKEATRWVHVDATLDGSIDIASAGKFNVNIIRQTLVNIEDPERRKEVLDQIAKDIQADIMQEARDAIGVGAVFDKKKKKEEEVVEAEFEEIE